MSWWKRLVKKAGALFGLGESHGGCNHDEIHLRQDTPEFEWFIAKAELETGTNLAHGMSHLANLLTYDPGRKEWIELLETYLEKAGPEAEKLLPQGNQLYYGTAAVQAYLHHRAGKLDQAVSLLNEVTQAKPDARYFEAWALDWLLAPGKIERLSDQTGLAFFATAINRIPEARASTMRQLRENHRYAELVDRFFARPQQNPAAVMLRVGLLRRAGRFEEGLQVAKKAFEASPNWHDAVGVGLLLRQQGEAQQAADWFRKSLELDPSDVSARLEAGDTFFEIDDWENALWWYDDALGVDTKQPWAKPSALYCRWKRTGEGRFREELLELMNNSPDNQRAHALAYRAYMPDLPAPEDASANMLRKLVDQFAESEPSEGDEPSSLKLTLNLLEAPSNMTAFRIEMQRLGRTLDVQVTVTDVQQPDPRLPVAPVKYLLWKFQGTDPIPALPEPPADIVDEVSRLARSRFQEEVNWADASHIAAKLGPARVSELLAVMVYPPDAPAETPALEWLPRVHHVVCQIVAHLDEGWEESVRRDALYSVLLGPSDWTTVAAIRILARIANEEPAYAAEIHTAFQKLADHTPNQGYCCWLRPLYVSWLQLPNLFPKEREQFQKTLQQIDRDDEKE